MFDITKLEIGDSAEYHITDAKGEAQYADHPTAIDEKGNPVQVPITITVASPGTKKAAKAQFKRDQARSARMISEMNGKPAKRTEDDEAKERAEFLAAVTESLNGFEYPGGAKALYLNPKLGHIADGVEKFYNDRGNFTGDSANS